jgi:hypothetical protein
MEIKVCPSCGSGEIEVAGNKVHCKQCDVTFTITPQGAKVTDLDPLGKDRERIAKLEQEVEDLKKTNRGTDGQQITEDDEEIAGEGDNDGIIKVTDDDGSEVE